MSGVVRPATAPRFARHAVACIAGVLLAVAVLLGGGGSPAPVPEAIIELAALAGLMIASVLGVRPLDAMRSDPWLAALIAAILLFPLLQLVPLPPMWEHLPGREAAAAALAAAGEGGGWQPWSLLPDATLAGALALIPAAVLLLLAGSLPVRERVRLVAVLAALGGAAALLGLVQFMRGADAVLSLYDEVHRG